jgi:hypothetical protein
MGEIRLVQTRIFPSLPDKRITWVFDLKTTNFPGFLCVDYCVVGLGLRGNTFAQTFQGILREW